MKTGFEKEQRMSQHKPIPLYDEEGNFVRVMTPEEEADYWEQMIEMAISMADDQETSE
jgi:hypothetical protein